MRGTPALFTITDANDLNVTLGEHDTLEDAIADAILQNKQEGFCVAVWDEQNEECACLVYRGQVWERKA